MKYEQLHQGCISSLLSDKGHDFPCWGQIRTVGEMKPTRFDFQVAQASRASRADCTLLTPPLPRMLCQNSTLLCVAASPVWGKPEQQGLQSPNTGLVKGQQLSWSELLKSGSGMGGLFPWVSTEAMECGWQQELCRYLNLLLFLSVCFTVGLLKLLQSLW